MKPEEIDQKIGMPDVEQEWRRFERDVIDQPRLAPARRPWMSRAAAIGWVGLVSSLALAATWYLHHDAVAPDAPVAVSAPAPSASVGDSELEPEEEALLSCWDETAGMYVFDNQELQLVVEALGLLYDVVPVFVNDEARHLRLYIRIVPQERSLDEIVTLLNTFQHIRMRLEDGQLIIE